MNSPGTPRPESLPETERIEKIVVHTAVDHIHAPQTGCRAHIHNIVVHQQVAAFDQFNTHLLRKKRVLEIRGIENSRGQQDDFRFVPRRRTGRGQRPQSGEQSLRIVIDGDTP